MLKIQRAVEHLVKFLRDRRGFAAGEFALVIPPMIALTFGTIEVSRYYQSSNQVVQVANMIGQMVSQLPNAAPKQDVQNIWQAAPLIAPEALRLAKTLGRGSWDQVLGVTITSVSFMKKKASCTTDCDYEAQVAWSVGSNPMKCGALREVTDGTPNARGTVPKELITQGTAIFVEASLSYSTTFGTSFVPPTTITESTWLRPRNAIEIKLTGSGLSSPGSNSCPGVA